MDWRTGSGKQLSFRDILNKVAEHHANNGSVFIGTDSFSEKKACVFAISIVLLGAEGQQGGRYFIKKEKTTKPTIAL